RWTIPTPSRSPRARDASRALRVPRRTAEHSKGDPMYIAMNRFRVNAGFEDGFEEMWRRRDSYLDQVPGFKAFRLLRGETVDGTTLFVSHSTWESRAAFAAWTESEAFRQA